MKILILKFENLDNYGTAMMGLNTISHLIKAIPENKELTINIYLTDDHQLDKIRNSLGDHKNRRFQIHRADIPKRTQHLWKTRIPTWVARGLRGLQYAVNRRFHTDIQFIPEAIETYVRQNHIDAVFFLGGDDLSEYRNPSPRFWELSLLKRLQRQTHVFLLGQSPGPFFNPDNHRTFGKLNHCQMLVREKNAVEYLKKEFNMTDNVRLMGDLAFLPLPRQKEQSQENKILSSYRLIPNTYITLVTSGIPEFYDTDEETFVSRWTEIVKGLLEQKIDKICLLAHTQGRASGEEPAIIRSVFKNLSSEEQKKVVLITEDIGPLRARWILGNGLFTISGRMHASVSTYQMEKPAICLAYSRKYKGVIGEGMGREDLIIYARNHELWVKGKIVKMVCEKVSYLKEHYSEIITEIPQMLNIQAEGAQKALEFTSKQLWN